MTDDPMLALLYACLIICAFIAALLIGFDMGVDSVHGCKP